MRRGFARRGPCQDRRHMQTGQENGGKRMLYLFWKKDHSLNSLVLILLPTLGCSVLLEKQFLFSAFFVLFGN